MDLKVLDSQSFEHGHTRCMDVERLTQLCICCAVHSANLDTQTDSQHTGRQTDRDMLKDKPADRYLYVVISEERL